MTDDYFEYVTSDIETRKVSEIEAAHDLVVEMKHEAEKFAKLANLAVNAEIQTLRNNLRGRWTHLTFPITGAKKWLAMLMKDDKIDKRKKYEEESDFKYLGHHIEELLDVEKDTITITSISSLGYDECAHYVVFRIKQSDRVFELTIPETEKISEKNIDYCHYGKLALSIRDKENTCSYSCFVESYDVADLKKKFQEFVNS